MAYTLDNLFMSTHHVNHYNKWHSHNFCKNSTDWLNAYEHTGFVLVDIDRYDNWTHHKRCNSYQINWGHCTLILFALAIFRIVKQLTGMPRIQKCHQINNFRADPFFFSLKTTTNSDLSENQLHFSFRSNILFSDFSLVWFISISNLSRSKYSQLFKWYLTFPLKIEFQIFKKLNKQTIFNHVFLCTRHGTH